MLYFWNIFLLGCSPEKPSSPQEEEQQDQAEQQLTDDTAEQAADPLYRVRPFCKRMTYSSTYNGETTTEIAYTWEGNTQNAPNWSAEHNEYGYITKSYSTSDGYISNSNISYECDGWCKVLTSVYESGDSAESLNTTTVNYTWEGNTQFQGLRYWVYNDLGYVIEQYDEGNGYSTTTTYTYDCNETWCKTLQSTTLLDTTEGQTESISQYTWEDNRQILENGSKLFNEYGYILEMEFSSPGSVTLETFTYECDE